MCRAAGKKAIRRKEVQVNGSEARTDLLLQEGDVVRVVMKVGSGAVWGSTAGECTRSTRINLQIRTTGVRFERRNNYSSWPGCVPTS
jgi:RNA-binding protein YlmH